MTVAKANPTYVTQTSQLKLRKNPKGEWEVWAPIHGTSRFKWWIISNEQADWYKHTFPRITIED